MTSMAYHSLRSLICYVTDPFPYIDLIYMYIHDMINSIFDTIITNDNTYMLLHVE